MRGYCVSVMTMCILYDKLADFKNGKSMEDVRTFWWNIYNEAISICYT